MNFIIIIFGNIFFIIRFITSQLHLFPLMTKTQNSSLYSSLQRNDLEKLKEWFEEFVLLLYGFYLFIVFHLQPASVQHQLPVLDERVQRREAEERVAAEQKRNEARRVREEQEAAYAASLSQDREREREEQRQEEMRREEALQKRLEEEEAMRRAATMEVEKKREEQMRLARLSVLSSLQPSSSAVSSSSTSTSSSESSLIRLRLPGGIHSRVFPLSAPLSSVALYAEQLLLESGHPVGVKPILSSGFPPVAFPDTDLVKSLHDLNLKGAIIYVTVKHL